MPADRTYQVAASGGAITVGEWGDGERPVLAIHGISSTHMLWLWTADHLRGMRLIAPDLRGRGASQGLVGGYGIARHADDVRAVLDHLGVESATVVGMSLGGFIATALAAAHPERVDRLLLVDGGLPMSGAAAFRGMTEAEVAAAFRDRFARIERTWTSLDEYRAFFIGATAPLLRPDDPVLAEYLGYDLVEGDGGLRVRLDGEAMAADAADLFLNDAAATSARALTVPTRLLYAEWSVGRDSAPAYSDEHLTPWLADIPTLTASLLPGTDHAATVMTDAGAAAVAAEIESLAAVTP